MSIPRLVPALVALSVLAAACTSAASEDSAPSATDPASSPTAEDSTETTRAQPTGPTEDPFEVDQIPGDDKRDVPSALDSMTNADFPEPLIDPDKVRSGGPPPDGIPPIDQPKFEPVSQIDWLEDAEPVLVMELEGEARAYPIQIMTWHEIVNDTIGGVPITVSYCPLCNSAVAFDRRLGDGSILDFGTSGRLFNSSLVMYDRQTHTLWTHFNGQAVIGTLTGTELTTYPVMTVGFADFATAHPDGLVLSKETGFDRAYGRNPYPGYDDINTPPFLFDGDVDDRLVAQTRVVVVRDGEDAVAVVQEDLIANGVVETAVAGTELVLFGQPGTSSALDSVQIADGDDIGATGAFIPTAGGQELTFTVSGSGEFTDDQTGSTWNIFGEATAGELEGERLEAVPHLNTFWFAIAAFSPSVVLDQP